MGILLFGGACQAAPNVPAPPAEPILTFSECPVVWETEAGTFRGILSRDPQQTSLTVTDPEALRGFCFLSGNTLQYEALSAEIPALPGPAGMLLEVLEIASAGALTQTESGFSGTLSDGTAFLLETDGTGALQSVTVSGEQFVFQTPDAGTPESAP